MRKLFALLFIAVITTSDLNAQKVYENLNDINCYCFCRKNNIFKYKHMGECSFSRIYASGTYKKKQNYYLLKYDIFRDTIVCEYDSKLSDDTLYISLRDYFGMAFGIERAEYSPFFLEFNVFDTIKNAYKKVCTEFRMFENDTLYKKERKAFGGNLIESAGMWVNAFNIVIPDSINKIVIVGYKRDMLLDQYQILPKILKKISKTQLQDFQTGEIFEYKKNVTFVYDKKNK